LPIDRFVNVNPRESIDQLIDAYEFTELSGHGTDCRIVHIPLDKLKSAIAALIDAFKR